MKRAIVIFVIVIAMLAFAGCGRSGDPVPKSAEMSSAQADTLASGYVKLLKSGVYGYSYIVPYDGMEMVTTEAAKNNVTTYRVTLGDKSTRIVQSDDRYYLIDDNTGEMTETTADKNLGGDLDFSGMSFIESSEHDGKTFEKYSMLRNEQEQEFTFVFESGELVGIHLSYIDSDAPYFEVTEFTEAADDALFELPADDTVSIEELAEGTYTGTLSGDSYSGSQDESIYMIHTTISPSEITLTVKDGQIELYSSAHTGADATILGVEAPPSPEFARTVSGVLALQQIDEKTITAEGDITSPEDDIWIYWDGDKKFERWEVVTSDDTYNCSASIAMSGGVPTAQIAINGSASHRTATVQLRLASN